MGDGGEGLAPATLCSGRALVPIVLEEKWASGPG